MKTINVTEAKAHLSRLLRRVARGETVVIVHRGRPIARIEPVRDAGPAADDAVLSGLEREGIVRRAALPPEASVLDLPRAAAPAGGDLLTALLEEREAGR